eukprot:COSAG06_NODE_360_length_16832_cov_9.250209_3_plen_327_part_00
MPFFYLLSGFVMAIAYGSQLLAMPGDMSGNDGKVFDRNRFYRNRWARLAPVYYLSNMWMVMIMGFFAVLGVDIGSPSLWTWLTFPFGLTSWFYYVAPPNGVTWTISTMMFFYVVFPYLLPRIQRWSPKKQLAWIGRCYVLQIITFVALAIILMDEAGNPTETGYWYGRAWPPSRLPVFLMGVLGALHRNRELHSTAGDAGAESWVGCFCGCGLCGDCCVGGGEVANARRTDQCLAAYLLMIILCVFNDHVLRMDVTMPGVMRVESEIWCPVLILALIMSSTRDGGRSITYRLMTTKQMQGLGDISMAFCECSQPVRSRQGCDCYPH